MKLIENMMKVQQEKLGNFDGKKRTYLERMKQV